VRSSLRHSFALSTALVGACRGADHPRPGTAATFELEVGKSGQTLRGVAGDGARVIVARGDLASSEIEARSGATVVWHVTLPASAGSIAMLAKHVAVAISGRGTITGIGAALQLHGEPSAAIVALDPATGAIAWRVPFDASEFASITALAALPSGGIVVGGTFSGTLRVGDATARAANPRDVVASAGKSDGFVATLDPDGQLGWIVRVGGGGADAVQGVAARGDRIALAGTFSTGAELLGESLAAFDEKLPFSDGFVAELDLTGAKKWVQTFGGKADDAVAGVAIDSAGRVAVAATIRDTIRLDGKDLAARGDGDGLVAWFSAAGEPGATTILGGTGFDGLRAITAVDDRVVVAGFFHGALALGKVALDSNNGDDSFFAVVDAGGSVEQAWHVGGPGREEITALSTVPGGFVAGIAHTAELAIDSVKLAAPADPASGAAVIGRPAP
jgi:outer membrane protein assembly factor BamB